MSKWTVHITGTYTEPAREIVWQNALTGEAAVASWKEIVGKYGAVALYGGKA